MKLRNEKQNKHLHHQENILHIHRLQSDTLYAFIFSAFSLPITKQGYKIV